LSEVTAKAFHIQVLPPIDTMFSYARKVIHTAFNPE
jgi:hypothetical protein